jgi:hypothetical protein
MSNGITLSSTTPQSWLPANALLNVKKQASLILANSANTNVDKIEAQLLTLAETNTKLAADVRTEVMSRLSPVQQGELGRLHDNKTKMASDVQAVMKGLTKLEIIKPSETDVELLLKAGSSVKETKEFFVSVDKEIKTARAMSQAPEKTDVQKKGGAVDVSRLAFDEDNNGVAYYTKEEPRELKELKQKYPDIAAKINYLDKLAKDQTFTGWTLPPYQTGQEMGYSISMKGSQIITRFIEGEVNKGTIENKQVQHLLGPFKEGAKLLVVAHTHSAPVHDLYGKVWIKGAFAKSGPSNPDEAMAFKYKDTFFFLHQKSHTLGTWETVYFGPKANLFKDPR